MYKIVLASASPRRKELLEQIGVEFEINASNCEEIITDTIPYKVVESLSLQKASDIAKKEGENTLILGSDTIVSINNEIIGKPKDEKDAFKMIKMLQGKTHQVYTGVTVIINNPKSEKNLTHTFHSVTDVTLYEMSDEQILEYIATKEPMDKAGAYAIQGIFAVYVKKIDGDYNTVVGLPIAMIYNELLKLGIDIKRRS